MLRELERAIVSHPLTHRLLFNGVTGALGTYVEAARKRGRYAAYRDRYDVAPSFTFNGPGITLYGGGDVVLGPDSYVGRHTRIQSKQGYEVRVGANTAVSHFVFCYTQNRVADQDMSRARNRNDHLEVREGDVAIGDHCWIGAFTFVTEGTAVGDDTVVGANAVVTRDLPPHCIAAGAPARVRQFKSHLDDGTAADLAAEYADALSADLAAEYGVD